MQPAPQPTQNDLRLISSDCWEIPTSFWNKMKVPARLFASARQLPDIISDRSLTQLVHTSALPGVVGWALAMPDIHQGYGAPVGGVFATSEDGIVSPGAIGYDINCGVRLLTSRVSYQEIKTHLPRFLEALFASIPSGVGRGGRLRLDSGEMDQVLSGGAKWAVEKRLGAAEDLAFVEEGGAFVGADPAKVSVQAKRRGADQVGSLGSGNHFVEVLRTETIFDPMVAKTYGLFAEQICILIHSGSRGLGHQVATDYIRIMLESLGKHRLGTSYTSLDLPDRELAAAPQDSKEGQDYLSAMWAAANFAWANRQILTHFVREVWEKEMAGLVADRPLSLLYDVAHNIGKIEEYVISGRKEKVLVHRKGATRAFPPDHPDIPEKYRLTGQPVLIPGSMGTASYVLSGAPKSMELSFGSSCHGAGRVMSRAEAKRRVHGKTLAEELKKKGITALCQSPAGLAEEAPIAYKDVDEVVNVVQKVGLSRKIARLVPLGVIKGG